jgi:tetratricopeptide (TPR) repeat protein
MSTGTVLCKAVPWAAVSIVFAWPAGCIFDGQSDLLRAHMADDRNAASKQQWDAVRGGVQLQIARQHYDAGRLRESETVLRQVLALAPEDVNAYHLATRVYLEMGQLAKAREVSSSACELAGGDAETFYLAGIVAQRYGEKEEALAHYLEAQSLAPNTPEYVMAAAELWVALDKPGEALRLVESRIRDFDGSAATRMLAARVCRMLDQREPAIEHSREARRLGGDDARLDIEAALILVWAGAYEEAIGPLRTHVDAAMTSRSLSASQRGGKGVGPANKKDAQQTNETPDSVVTASVIHALARAYMATGHEDDARAVLKPLMSADGTDVTAWSLFARAAMSAGDLTAAYEAISTFHSRGEPTSETLLLEALVLHLRGDSIRAGRAAARVLELDGRNESALWLAGQAAQAMGETEVARQAYVRALAEGMRPHVTRHFLAKLEETPSLQSMLDALTDEKAIDDLRPAGGVQFVGSQVPDSPATLAEGASSE